MPHPNINVTPLIDVLLVLLIVFMIVAPTKPADFKARIPQEPNQNEILPPNPKTLIVALNPDSTLRLNKEVISGTVEETEKLTERLSEIFRQRTENGVYAEGRAFKADLSESQKIEKTVFIKAPRAANYGSVAKIVDAVKLAGANPISLQIDDLE